jgi:hypothetical protein
MMESLFTQPQQMIREWNESVRQQLGRLGTAGEELEQAQADAIARWTEAAEHGAKLGRELGARSAELPKPWRKLWLDMVTRSFDVARPAS